MTEPTTPTTTTAPRERLASLRLQIKTLEEAVQDIYRASVNAPAAEKVCGDDLAKMLAEARLGGFKPIDVHGITAGDDEPYSEGYGRQRCGTWVRVRPAGAEVTYLGVMLGKIATATSAEYHPESGVLHVRQSTHNPAIYVPDLGRVVFGEGSFWSVIESPAEIRAIGDKAVGGVFYVRALRSIAGTAEAELGMAPPVLPAQAWIGRADALAEQAVCAIAPDPCATGDGAGELLAWEWVPDAEPIEGIDRWRRRYDEQATAIFRAAWRAEMARANTEEAGRMKLAGENAVLLAQ